MTTFKDVTDTNKPAIPPEDSRKQISQFMQGLQDEICTGLEAIDGGKFQEESWQRAEGGGGRSRVLKEGTILEQGGVKFF